MQCVYLVIRIKAFFLLCCFAIAIASSSSAAVIGDINQDGKIDLIEAVIGDINQDWKIDLIESVYAMQVSSGLYPELPDSCVLTGMGSWEDATVYNLCDVVEFGGVFYACTFQHTSRLSVLEPPDVTTGPY